MQKNLFNLMGMHKTDSIKILMKQICRQVYTKDNENVIPAVIKRESRNLLTRRRIRSRLKG